MHAASENRNKLATNHPASANSKQTEHNRKLYPRDFAKHKGIKSIGFDIYEITAVITNGKSIANSRSTIDTGTQAAWRIISIT
jgi:hypothetical protein